ncbi:integrator complex subunit 4-like [Antedon mediterranea]|uniref:integrator complex subunit 4-like n=1 Tax=Antedon mediterranea TaxID=105859 RepID=UPI003AF97C6F
MAAHLKKRAYVEFSVSVIKEEVSKPKTLRLTVPVSSAPPLLDLNLASGPQEILTQLKTLTDSLPLSPQHVDSVIHTLIEHLRKEEIAYIKARIISILGILTRTPDCNKTLVIDELTQMLRRETSHKVCAELFGTIYNICRAIPNSIDLHQKLVVLAYKHLSNSDHSVRQHCLSIIGTLGSKETHVKINEKQESPLQVLTAYAKDQDPRVRSSAFEAMLSFHQKGQVLEQSIYKQVYTALHDDSESVRLAALRLMWVIGHVYPESLIPVVDSDEKLRLVDDAFAKICQLVNDSSVLVRTTAVGLLGSLHRVSPHFLEQTLDKKLMSGLRRKRTAHERQKEQFVSGEWSSGKKWGDDAPKEELDPEAVTLMDTGACGAFVHGLEDEFLEVRHAALDSLCELASQSPAFASLSLDYLVDMLNDEIESVRLNAVYSLHKISKDIVLREDQLETVLNGLEDSSSDIRQGLHQLLYTVSFATKMCLHLTLQFLLKNLNKYPQDRISIWKCSKALGENHSNLALTLVPELLGTHAYFAIPEPDMDDPGYICVMILIFNSAVTQPTMTTLLPEYTKRHYAYLRDSLPHLVPLVRHFQVVSSAQTHTLVRANCSPQEFLQQALEKLEQVGRLDMDSGIKLMETTIRDLRRVVKLEENLVASADFYSLYLQCQLLLTKAMKDKQWSVPAPLCPQHNLTISAITKKVIELSYQLEHLFVGCSAQDLASVYQLRLRAITLQLLVQLRGRSVSGLFSKSNINQQCENYLLKLSTLQRYFAANNLQPHSFTQALFSEMHKFEASKPGILAKFLQPLLFHHRVPCLILDNKVKQACAEIFEPVGGSDNPLRFTAGLALALNVDCILDNVEYVQSIQIQVKFPDTQTQLFTPRISDFRHLNALRHHLVTQVYLSHSLWSDPCQVEICIVLGYTMDGSKGPLAPQFGNSDKQCALQLCKPVKVYIMPRATKK